MSVLFLACCLVGLLLAVYAMLYGVERRRVSASPAPPHEATGSYDPAIEPSPVFNLQVVAALVVAFGLTGYLLTRFTALGVLQRTAIAGLLAAVSAGGAVLLIARWAIPGARDEAVDERFLLQGHPARVTQAIAGEQAGEIAYVADGRRHTVAARSLDGEALTVDTDVAIERVEDGVAYVEQWARVEERL
jgi:hypothetical protein